MTTKKQLKGPMRPNDFVAALFAVGNAYDGARTIIAKAKEAGTFHDPERAKRTTSDSTGRAARKNGVRARVQKLVERVEGGVGAIPRPRSAHGVARPVRCEANATTYPDVKSAAEATFPLTKGVKDEASLRVGISICLKSLTPRATGGVVYRAATKEEAATLPRLA